MKIYYNYKITCKKYFNLSIDNKEPQIKLEK